MIPKGGLTELQFPSNGFHGCLVIGLRRLRGSLGGFVSKKSLPRSPFCPDGFAPDELFNDVQVSIKDD